MEFSTKIMIPKPPFEITHQNRIILSGSCFTENIGSFLSGFCFNVNINPFGIIYNPVSIFNSLNAVVKNNKYTENDLSERNELYFSFDHHGSFSDTNKNIVLESINRQIENAHKHFQESSFIFITLGTSFVYHHHEKNKIVANCHKLPNTHFEKKLLTTDQIIEAYNIVKESLKGKTILFTVSPVRHWRDGAVENQRSKSILIESVHQLMAEHKNCFYFPAYEIMMDELRDYRYYAEDMLHPSEVAVKYIWQRFCETYFSDKTLEINKFIEKGNALFAHRIKHKDTKEALVLAEQKEKFGHEFHSKYPDLAASFFSKVY